MKIDATRATAFWQNPEKYRLHYLWNLVPIETRNPDAPLSGRHRGSAFHEIIAGQPVGDHGEREVASAIIMAAAAREKYRSDKILLEEKEFVVAIPDSPHQIMGRVDRVVEREDGTVEVVDWKTSGRCTQRELMNKASEYVASLQTGFYICGASALWYQCVRSMVYRIVIALPDSQVEFLDVLATYTVKDKQNFFRYIHQTCEIIEFMKKTFGIDKPWPRLYDKFWSGYDNIYGQTQYEGLIPDGFELRKEHLDVTTVGTF